MPDEIIVGGVDEAGRGSLIGPLVIAGVCAPYSKIGFLKEADVKDSKMLLPSTRTRLYDLIAGIVQKVLVIEIPPIEIDDYVLHGKKLHRLNFLEAIKVAKIIDDLGAEVVYVDSADVNPTRYAEDILSFLKTKARIISEHHADSNYVIVSAASIMAKVTRDKRIEELAKKHGPLGSGYPSDPRTIKFVKDWVEKKGSMPEFIRKSWKTLKKFNLSTLDTFSK